MLASPVTVLTHVITLFEILQKNVWNKVYKNQGTLDAAI